MNEPEQEQRRTAIISELTGRWGYRDISELIRHVNEQLDDTEGSPTEGFDYFCVLQRPDGSPLYCRRIGQLTEELEEARVAGVQYAQCPAPHPADPANWWLVVGNFEDEEDEEDDPSEQEPFPAFMESLGLALEAVTQLTSHWGYRDVTKLVKAEFERQEMPLNDPTTRERPRFLCVLQTPAGSLVPCWQPARVFEECETARVRGREYPQGCPAPSPETNLLVGIGTARRTDQRSDDPVELPTMPRQVTKLKAWPVEQKLLPQWAVSRLDEWKHRGG